jgi:hypothetical protein
MPLDGVGAFQGETTRAGCATRTDRLGPLHRAQHREEGVAKAFAELDLSVAVGLPRHER